MDAAYHSSQHQAHVRPVSAPLHVVTAIFNPSRSAARYRLFEAFRRMVEQSGALLTTVELAYGDRHWEVTSPDNPDDVRVRARSVLFSKENLLNLGWRHVTTRTDPDARYLAWVDADVAFARPDWAAETVHQLQLAPVVQLWSDAINLGEDGQPANHWTSFARDWQQTQHTLPALDPRTGRPITPALPAGVAGSYVTTASASGRSASHSTLETGQWHSGLAWAARREVLDAVGGLGDVAVLGSGDHHMAWALVGDVQKSIHRMTSPGYQRWWSRWQERAEQAVRRDIGCVPGTILAHYHGALRDRRYLDRWQILNVHAFDPYADLVTNSQGVHEWAGNKPGLERDVIHYFDLRREP